MQVDVLRDAKGGAYSKNRHALLRYKSSSYRRLSLRDAGPGQVVRALKGNSKMVKYAIIFAVISLIAGALGFSGVAAGTAGIAKVLFGLFLILALIFIALAALGVGAAKKMMK
jgi:uncharacterized membrane protein YtjA (UPF0391 family)